LLLSPDEPAAVEVRSGDGPFIVLCEHASNRIPRSLGTLGLTPADLNRHIAWDPGALEVADGVAARLDGALIFQRYSRLVVDCNRSLELADAFTTFSEDTTIPGNVALAEEEKARRVAAVWRPFHDTVDRVVEDRMAAGLRTALVTIHTFTPVYRGLSRPWHVGIISTDDRALADGLLKSLGRDPALTVGDNQPYSAKDHVDYTIRRHGLNRGLPHVMIEIRNDLLTDAAAQETWASKLAGILQRVEITTVAA
jgi:predicted N-formylglutamate amidohydrolase